MCEGQLSAVGSDTWKPLNGWTGPDATLYMRFDSPVCLVLKEVDQNMGPIPLVTGKAR